MILLKAWRTDACRSKCTLVPTALLFCPIHRKFGHLLFDRKFGHLLFDRKFGHLLFDRKKFRHLLFASRKPEETSDADDASLLQQLIQIKFKVVNFCFNKDYHSLVYYLIVNTNLICNLPCKYSICCKDKYLESNNSVLFSNSWQH